MTMRKITIAAVLASMFCAGTAIAAAPPKAGSKPEAAPAPADTTTPADKVPSLREVAAHVQWYRGNYSRTATGFEFQIPSNYHLAENNDARNLEMASGHPDDPDAVAWIAPLNEVLTNPQAWVIRVRWRGDGLITASSADLESKQLETAMALPAEKRLASSGGNFKRFVDEPQLVGHVVDWVEERNVNGKGVFDCHAVRLARRGLLEFSIIGVSEAIAKNCAETLHAFTDKVSFDESHEYPQQAGTNPKAAYSLTNLVTQTK
jgi:hypothetical protein